MDGLIKQSLEYKGFQKNFKVEVTKFEELEEVNAEIKLKQLLWSSLAKWDQGLSEWMQVWSSIQCDSVFFVDFRM